MTGDYVDRDGKPISMAEWVALIEADRSGMYRRIAVTDIGEAHVSTVWLGLNHDWFPWMPGLYFETMIFGGPYEGAQWRYSTREDAEESHARIVARLEAGLAPALVPD